MMKIHTATTTRVAVARSGSHAPVDVRRAMRDLLDNMDPGLPGLIRSGDRILVKPFLRHGGVRDPASRLTSHPQVIAAVIEAVRDCGAVVTLGDEGSKKLRTESIRPDEQWIHDLAKSSGAHLVSFARAGARRVRSGLAYPRTHLVSSAVLDVDAVVNCANFQPHGTLVWSGAVKNMFNSVVGSCQQHLHDVFPHPDDLARAIVDVCIAVKPTVSFLDLTTVRDPADGAKFHPVGLLLAGRDPLALDAVAAHAVGSRGPSVPTIRIGAELGLGCADVNRITLSGSTWQAMRAVQLEAMARPGGTNERFISKAARLINTIVLRPNPTIHREACTRCGDCRRICPVQAVVPLKDGMFRIDPPRCAHCNLCLEACEEQAIDLQFGPVATACRRAMNRPLVVSRKWSQSTAARK